MKSKEIKIEKGQYLSEIYTIESNTILFKTLTGLGATYSEIKADRDSIIIEPNQPAIIGKCSSKLHSNDNLLGVMEKVTIENVIEYLENTLADKKKIKILTTPESFYKVKQAFEEIEEPMYLRCFLLMDECQKYIQDNDYREAITLPIEDFFEFENKAMVSATPIIPTDPRFKHQDFTLVRVIPQYDFRKGITVVHTNNVLEALRNILKNLEEGRPVCLFVNSTDMIFQLIKKLGIDNETSVFCASKSVDKLKRYGFKRAYDKWNISYLRTYNFFTSRFFTALDINIEEKPNVIFVTEPYFSEYTAIDPNTDVVQAIGRFRNGISNCIHLLNTHSGFSIRTREGIMEYIKGCETAYKTIKNLYDCAISTETRNAFRNALSVLPFNRMLRNGKIDYFAIDNYIDEQLVKSSYNNIELLSHRYLSIPTLQPVFEYMGFPVGDIDRLQLESKSGSIKESRRKIVEIMETLKNDMDSPLIREYIDELRKIDPFIIEAYMSLGKEILEINNFSQKRIREAMILKRHNTEIYGIEYLELVHNSFKIGREYTLEYIKRELLRFYEILGIAPKKSITAQSIRKFFIVEECKIRGKRGLRMVESII